MTEHTPGPWSVGSGFPDSRSRIFATGVSVYVAKVNAGPRNFEANARLIASAPDLLAALEAIKQEVGECYCADNVAVPGPCGYCIARAAIAKAKDQ